MLFHLFACCWVYVGSLLGGWCYISIDDVDNLEGLDKPEEYVYITAVYLVCTTATTIGYGDFSG